MRNRVIVTSKIDDLILIDAESRPITPVTSNSIVLTSTKIKFDLLRSLKQRLDSQAIQYKYIQNQTGQLADRLYQIRKTSQPKKASISQNHSNFLEQLQNSLIRKQETKLEKVYKKYKDYEKQSETCKQIRINHKQDNGYAIEQIDMKTPMQTLELHQQHFANMDKRIKEKTIQRGRKKYYSFWKSQEHTQVVQQVQKQNSCFMGFVDESDARMNMMNPKFRQGYLDLVNNIKDKMVKNK